MICDRKTGNLAVAQGWRLCRSEVSRVYQTSQQLRYSLPTKNDLGDRRNRQTFLGQIFQLLILMLRILKLDLSFQASRVFEATTMLAIAVSK